MRLVATMLGALALWPALITAHASLVKATPSARSVVARVPPRAELTFNERLEPAYSTMSVTAAGGERVDLGDARVGPDDPRKLSVGLPALPAGAYVIKFRVLSVDGHVVESQVRFTVRP